jgi:hypothetical protein
MALNNYILETQRLLHDPAAAYFSTTDLTAYINTGRSEIAIAGQCVRVLLSGTIVSCAVSVGGSNYVNPSVSFSSPSGGTGAVGQLSVGVGGAITSCLMIAGGSGFDPAATATVSDPASAGVGTGAVLTPTVAGANMMVINQEVYSFASRNPIAQLTAGVAGIQGVLAIAASWGSTRPALKRRSWDSFQAKWRAWAAGWINNPIVWAQYQQGANGSIYLAPIPANNFNMEWDTYCFPLPLTNDTDPEAIPYPWTDAVPYYAAYRALFNAQRYPDAAAMYAEYQKYLLMARKNSEPPYIPDPYDDGDI